VLGVIAVGLNLWQTLKSSATPLRGNALLLFFTFGAAAFVLAGLARAGLALLDVTQSLQFTWFGPALSELNFYGFFAMVMFGAIYAILPRLLGVGLPWPKLMRAQFWCCACGLVLLVLPLVAGGLVEQAKLENTNEPFLAAMQSTLPFLRVSTIG